MKTANRFVAVGTAMALSALMAGCPGEGSAKPTVGDTVVARWSGASFYEGKLESLTETKAKVAWLDGSSPSEVDLSSVFLLPKAGSKPGVSSGDYVLAKWSTSTKWYGAKLTGDVGDTIPVKYTSDGSTGNVAPDKVLEIPAAIAAEVKAEEELTDLKAGAQAAGTPNKPDGWAPKAGDKIIATWVGSSYYSGKVQSVSGDNATVAWADGSTPSESPIATMGPEPGPGDAELPAKGGYVLVKSGTRWSYGQALSVGDGQFEVKTESGETKTVKPGEFTLLKK